LRHGRNEPGKRKFGSWILILVLIAGVIYVIFATSAGEWLAENVANPVFSVFSSSASPSPSSSVSSTSSQAVTDKVTIEENTYYALQYGIFADKDNAATAASYIKARGGAGYLRTEDDKYRCIIATFKTKSDADAVKENLESEDISTIVREVKSEELSFNITASETQTQSIKNSIEGVLSAADKLIELSIKNDKGEDIKDDLDTLAEDLDTIYQDINSLTENEGGEIAKIKSIVSTVKNTVDDLNENYTKPTTGYLAYAATDTVYAVCDFINSFS